MSNFTRRTKNPLTDQFEDAQWLDNYYGPHKYGVFFPSTNSHYPEDSQAWEFDDPPADVQVGPHSWSRETAKPTSQAQDPAPAHRAQEPSEFDRQVGIFKAKMKNPDQVIKAHSMVRHENQMIGDIYWFMTDEDKIIMVDMRDEELDERGHPRE